MTHKIKLCVSPTLALCCLLQKINQFIVQVNIFGLFRRRSRPHLCYSLLLLADGAVCSCSLVIYLPPFQYLSSVCFLPLV